MTQKTKKWTVMFYLAGDNNLSEDMITSLKGMQTAMTPKNSDEQINLIAIYDSGYPTVKITTYCFTHANSSMALKDCAVEIKPVQTTGKKARNDEVLYIVDFVNSVADNPDWKAENYALIMSGHSDAILGKTMFRDSNPDTKMNLSYLGNILTIAEKSLGADRNFDVLGFDSCMMGMLEVGCELKDAADFLITSQGFAPTDGWAYDEILKNLVAANGNLDARTFSESIVNNQIEFSKNYTVGGRSMTLSAVDLSEAENLKKLLNNLAKNFNQILNAPIEAGKKTSAEKAQANAVVLDTVKNLIQESHYYSQTYLHEQAADILDFVNSLSSNCELKKKELEIMFGEIPQKGAAGLLEKKLDQIQKSCKEIQDHIKEYVLINRACGAEYQFSEGVSVFFPWTLLALNMIYWQYKKLKFAKNGNDWLKFIEKFVQITLRANKEPSFEKVFDYLDWRNDVAAGNRASSFRDTEMTRASTAKASTAKAESDAFYKFFGRFRNHPIYHDVIK